MSVIRFDPQKLAELEDFLENFPDPDDMLPAALEEAETQVRDAIARLDALEPKNEQSEAYDNWANLHEDLEDLLDEILDDLEERR